MSLFDFVLQNKDDIEKILEAEENTLELEPCDFDFSYDDIAVEWEDGQLAFSAEIGSFTFTTCIPAAFLKESLEFLKRAKNPDIRKVIIEAIEDNMREDAEQERDMAKDSLTEAQQALKDAEENLTDVVDSLGELKNEWNVP